MAIGFAYCQGGTIGHGIVQESNTQEVANQSACYTNTNCTCIIMPHNTCNYLTFQECKALQ